MSNKKKTARSKTRTRLRKPRRPKSRVLRLTISETLARELSAKAKREGIPKYDLVRRLLRDAVLQVPLFGDTPSGGHVVTNYSGSSPIPGKRR